MCNVKIIRKKPGINQQEAAAWLGISRSLVNHSERGSRNLLTQVPAAAFKAEVHD